MNQGRIMQIGTSKEVYSHPDNVWVGGFMGTPPMNFLECIVETKNGHAAFTSEDFKLSIPDTMAKVMGEKTKDREVVLGFRPEDATLTFRDEEGAVKTRVYAIEPIGDALLVDLLIGQNIIKVRVRPDLELQSDSNVYLRIMLDKVHLFDKKNQQKIL
jgi:multiple sugar transport system ATP-binding protein